MADKFIGDNIRLVYDVLAEANTSQKRGILLLIDFEKAFDSVSWSFIYKFLIYFNFPENTLNWIKLFNTEIKSRVIINNTISSWFRLE